ncbi:MAG: 1-acyl-sn-glycerol-3-phosphate acyltransferase [Muribaculaceae bacterium]|nr:1-acyl-sn-glycerol-3-phosphate acyltransferase [Muribaculaceae bacterium]
MNIDLSGIIRSRLGDKGKLIPSFLLRPLERIIRQDELNSMLDAAGDAKGSDFARLILRHLDITLEVEGLGNIPGDEKFVFASNHPLGGLDGIALVAILGEKYGDDMLRVPVNDLLLHVGPLREVFLPVNKFGAQGREGAEAINRAFEEGRQIMMFPAGLVSRLHADGSIHDLLWQKSFVAKALEYGRRIVPIRFEALNSMRFYKAAKWRKKLGIGFNLEQILLPSELVNAGGSRFRITFLPPVDPAPLRDRGHSPRAIALSIQQTVMRSNDKKSELMGVKS